MRVLFVILFISFSINGIGQQKLPDSNFTGIIRDTGKNGKVLKETPYLNGKKNGVEKLYYLDGDLKAEEPYVNGELNGVKKSYYESGMLASESPCINGKINGVFKEYYEQGYLKCARNYVNGKRNGVSKEYGSTNGELVSASNYKDDILDGIRWEYYANWKVRMDTIYKDGKPIGITQKYFDDSAVRREIMYKNGVWNGISKDYYKNGAIKFIYSFKNGNYDGAIKEYYSNGKLKRITFYREGFPKGVWKDYYESGELKREISYKHIQKNSIQTAADTPRISKEWLIEILLGDWEANKDGKLMSFSLVSGDTLKVKNLVGNNTMKFYITAKQNYKEEKSWSAYYLHEVQAPQFYNKYSDVQTHMAPIVYNINRIFKDQLCLYRPECGDVDFYSKISGFMKEYYKNGKVMSETLYSEGKPGIIENYDETGKKIK
jgi:antitoxin component YwqK of YwqJK toxin-antitoxin module